MRSGERGVRRKDQVMGAEVQNEAEGVDWLVVGVLNPDNI